MKKPIALPVGAGDLLRVLMQSAAQRVFGRKVALGFDVSAEHSNGIQFVPAYATIENLSGDRLDFEPPPRPLPHERNRIRPIVISNDKDRFTAAAALDPTALVIGLCEAPARVLFGDHRGDRHARDSGSVWASNEY